MSPQVGTVGVGGDAVVKEARCEPWTHMMALGGSEEELLRQRDSKLGSVGVEALGKVKESKVCTVGLVGLCFKFPSLSIGLWQS